MKTWSSVLKMRHLDRATGRWTRGYMVFSGVVKP